jgi:glucan phosphoethanolaminetransferase (alkaline phosphatase superfamily)
MRAIGLFCTLAVAHLLMLSGRTVVLSPWSPMAYFWPDVLVGLLFAGFEHLVRRENVLRVLYAILVAYIAINVPVAWALSSPLTWTMMRAAGGPLRDSIVHYFTLRNFAAMVLVIGTGWLAPRIFRTVKASLRPRLIVAALVFTALGPLAATRVDTAGLDRNAFTALWPSRLPSGLAGDEDWRSSPFGMRVSNETLSQYRAAAVGRNVVLITLESTGAPYLQLYGATVDPMPNLTRLATHSVVFERAYTVYPESVKGLLTVLCSRYPAFQTPTEAYADVACPSLAQLLRDAGYRTALFHSGRFMYLGMEVIRNRGFDTLEDAGAIGGNVNSSFGVDEPAAVERILSWIDAGPREQPFFITYMPIAGHHPYAVPEEGPFPSGTEFGNYQNALHYGDKSLGDLIRGLRERNLEEKTLFVLLGDHGEAFGQHEGNFGHSLYLFEENIRVPYLIAAPGLFPEQIRSRRTASVIDTAPTILDLLGLPVPSEMKGVSLLDPSERMALFFTDYSLGFLGLYDSCWKYILEVDSGRSKLFDVCADPAETKDLSAEETARVGSYQRHVEGWIRAQ